MPDTTANILSVGVVGDGSLGDGVRTLLAAADYEVVSVDPGAGYETLADVDLVIELLPCDEVVKSAALTAIGRHVRPECLIASSTSSLSLTRLARCVPHPERFGGLHFFDPPETVRAVEVVRTRLASDATVQALQSVVVGIGSRPLPVRDQPGLLVDHLLLPYLNQAIGDYDDGLASAEDLQTAVQLGLGYPIGPLQLADRLGLDVLLDATDAVYAATRERRFAAPPLLRELVAAGHLGDRVGVGLVAGNPS